ncbi:MAG TPA: hypothetical protein VKA39_08870 [Beijerinckiaceae bacterium]|nr:hypothetical protein [Beijerinckiaceae bacterium]
MPQIETARRIDPEAGRRRAARCLAAALAGACLVLPLETSVVQAGDDAGVHEFLMRESGRGRSAAPEPARYQPAPIVPAPVTHAAATVQQYFDAPVQRAPARAKVAPPVRAEFTNLQRTVDLAKPSQSDTQRGLGSKAVALLMQDPTLRPGDVVMFPDGPKVFAGSSGRHNRADFQDIDRSKAVPKDLRKAVLALTRPSASPAAEARRRVADKQGGALLGTAQQASADVRVVYPSAFRR